MSVMKVLISTNILPVEIRDIPSIMKGDKGDKGRDGSYTQKAYKTYASMVADKDNIPDNTNVLVNNDPDKSKNAYYSYDGTEFTKSDFDPQGILTTVDVRLNQAVESASDYFQSQVADTIATSIDNSTVAYTNAINTTKVQVVTDAKAATKDALDTAVTDLFVNGGLPATPFKTRALMIASTLPANSYAQVTDDIAHNGLYVKEAGAWIKSKYDPLAQANAYTDAAQLELTEPLRTTITNEVKLSAQTAIDAVVASSGFILVDSFELGATITKRNQALRHTADGNLYKWGGNMPKVVPSGSTPESTGGTHEGAWLNVTDTALRQEFQQYKAETKENNKSLAGNNRATSIERERRVMRSAFMLPNYDHMHGAGADYAQISEAMGMHYWFDPTMPREDQHGIVNRYMQWGAAAVAQRGIPVPYFGTLSTFVVSATVNAHHFFWGAKMLLEHYVRYGDVKHLNKAIEICDWIMANLTYGTSPNRRIARTQVDKISVKTISSADTLLRLSKITGNQKYKTLYYENLSWVRENMMHTDGIFSVDVDAETPVKTDGVSHEQLEMIDGMIDAYIWSGDKTLLDYAHAHYNAVIKKWFMNIPDVVNSGMPNIQIGYVGRKFLNNDYKGIGETIALRAITTPANRNADGSIAGNIYAMCYALAFLSTPDESHNARSHIRFGENDKSVIAGLNAGSKDNATGIMVGNESGRESLGVDLLSIGSGSGRFNEGSKVIAIGDGAAERNKANGSIYIGTESGFKGEGGNGVFAGYRAGYINKGINVAGFGYEAGMNNTGNNCTFIGWQAGKNNAENDVFIMKGQTATPLIKANFTKNIVTFALPNSSTVGVSDLGASTVNISLDRTTNELVFTVNLGAGNIKTGRVVLT